jgi:ABC-2 type transport system ATP-binding protein
LTGAFLTTVRHQVINTLSKGYKQRVCFAQSIIHDPEYLVLDEPTDGLDPNQKHEVRLMIRNMAAEKAIILSTHILDEMDAVCTRAIIIADGQIVADETPDDLRKKSSVHGAVTLAIARWRYSKVLLPVLNKRSRALDLLKFCHQMAEHTRFVFSRKQGTINC